MKIKFVFGKKLKTAMERRGMEKEQKEMLEEAQTLFDIDASFAKANLKSHTSGEDLPNED